MTEQSFGPGVLHVLLGGLTQLLTPSERLRDLFRLRLQVLYGLFDSFGALVRAEVRLSLPLKDVAIETF